MTGILFSKKNHPGNRNSSRSETEPYPCKLAEFEHTSKPTVRSWTETFYQPLGGSEVIRMHLSYRQTLSLTFGLGPHLLPEMGEWEEGKGREK